MTLETLFIFTMALILLWVKPGPGQALKITTTLNSGLMNGFAVVLGIITGCVTFFMIAVLGTTVLTSFFNDISIFLKLIGGAYLIYLGVKGLNNIKKGQWAGRLQEKSARSLAKNYALGLFTNLANPLPIFFFLGLIPTLVPIADMTVVDILIGAGIIVTVGLVVDGLLLVLVDFAKEALSETTFVKRINIVTSIGFAAIGLFLLYSAFFHDRFTFNVI